ncbi:hypothetical protein Zm00014a_006167 [Zea mays]|uniref:Uncharacterized protein n=1 Tax=Zea mays TaxID=4577 RepID=A0A3L6EEG8_MAIZE|nr:hypothetical protein Zm00014a_006167 [Zea mays]
MQSNYKAWCLGFAPLCVGGDMESVAVQEFNRTLFNICPDIALNVAQTIFQSDVRSLLPHVSVPCHIVQSTKDLAVPVVVSEYMHRHLGGDSIVEDGHLRVFNWPTMGSVLTEIDTKTSIKDLTISSDEKFLAVNRSSGPCRVWDLQSSEVVASLPRETGEIIGFCRFSNKADNSHVLFITVMEGDIKV